jgi:hypothetical protein
MDKPNREDEDSKADARLRKRCYRLNLMVFLSFSAPKGSAYGYNLKGQKRLTEVDF